MKEFKAGDLIFDVNTATGISLDSIDNYWRGDDVYYPVETKKDVYTNDGKIHIADNLPGIFHATPENRQALVTLYGEDAVPKLPLRGSDLTKKLLESQNMQACFCAETNDDDARKSKNLNLIVRYKDGYFWTNGGEMFGDDYAYAVPVDNYGNEITELLSN